MSSHARSSPTSRGSAGPGRRARRSREAARGARGASPPPRRPEGLPAVPLHHPAFLLTVLVAVGVVVALVTFRIMDTDFWQHLLVGREIARLGRVPDTQQWIWPQYGAPVHPPSWGFRLLLWKFWEAGQLPAMFVWRWLTALLALAIGWVTARRMGATGFSGLLVAGAMILPLRLRVEPRPETLAFVLIALQFLVHETLRRMPGRASPWRWPALMLPLLALVWANVHISYWLGLAIQFIYLADAWIAGRRDPERGAWVGPRLWLLAASGAISFVNPGGLATLMEPVQYWSVWRHELIYRQISELGPPVWSENVRNLLWLLVAGWPLLIVLRARRHGLDFAEVVIAALFLAQGLTTSRLIAFLAVAAVPFLARDLGDVLSDRRPPRWAAPPWARAAGVSALLLAGLALEWGDRFATPGFGLEPMWRPLAACDFIARHGIRGRDYNVFELGGYLLWRFWPERDRLPFMDIHQSGTVEDRRTSAQARTDPGAWADLDRRHHFDWVLLDRFHSGDLPTTDILDADTTFALVFLDDAAAVYVRRRGPLAAVADSFAYRFLHAGFASAAETMQAVNDSLERPALQAEIARVEAESPFHALALSWEANLLHVEGRTAEAREALRACLAIHPHFPYAYTRLAEADLALGRGPEARTAARRAVPNDGMTDRLRTLIFEAKGRGGPPDEPIVPAKLPDGWTTGR